MLVDLTDEIQERIAQSVWMNLCCSLASSKQKAKRIVMCGPNDVAAAVALALYEHCPPQSPPSPSQEQE